MPILIVTLPDDSEVSHELTDETISLGRVSDNAIQIDDASVSSHHAELMLRDGDYILKDIGSTNGTRINGKTVAAEVETTLRPNDYMTFGNISVRYVTDASAANQQPLPVESEVLAAPASSTAAPSNFANASPFQTKKEKKEPAVKVVMALGVLALLAAIFAIVTALGVKPPM